jgi:hypothetical protein
MERQFVMRKRHLDRLKWNILRNNAEASLIDRQDGNGQPYNHRN